MLRSLALITLSLACAPQAHAQAVEGTAKPKQLVLVSFDGAGDNALWARSRATAKEVGATVQ